jgi:phosphoribulokinase
VTVPHKQISIQRARLHSDRLRTRPIMLAIAGDSAAGKTTLTRGLAQALGPDRITTLCVDDYHRYDRQERKGLPFTPLHPECNYVEIMEQHLQLLALGQPILKPVYDHRAGTLTRPVLVEPAEFVIVEGLLPLHTRLSRACLDITVFLDPPEPLRHRWKIRRDTAKRGYTAEQVVAELTRRRPESAAFIRPQRAHAAIVVRFSPVDGRDDRDGSNGQDAGALSATVLLRPTIPHPDLTEVLDDDREAAIHLKLTRDDEGKPVDVLHIHGHAPREASRRVEDAIWSRLGIAEPVPPSLGLIDRTVRSEPLAIVQLILLHHLFQGRGGSRQG